MTKEQSKYLLARAGAIRTYDIKHKDNEPKIILSARKLIDEYEEKREEQRTLRKNSFIRDQRKCFELVYKGDFTLALNSIKALENEFGIVN